MRIRQSQVAPPGGAPILGSALSRWAPADAELQIRAMLRARLGTKQVSLHRSGREALRFALCALAHSCPERDEVIVPAYTCYSVPAAVVAAGLKVRLVEVDLRGRIDPLAFSALPLERAAAVIVCNLFGHCEPILPWSRLAQEAGIAVIDDAAQALGATSNEGAAGARGTLGILSFGRGKPLSALGGGACAWHDVDRQGPGFDSFSSSVSATRPNAIRAVAAAALHDVALQPWVFRQLKRVPALGIGETHFDPDFARGPIHGESLALASAQLPKLDRDAERRRSAAESLIPVLRSAGYAPLAGDADEVSVFPRLAVLAPSEALRKSAIARLAEFGAGGLYPSAASEIKSLQNHLAVKDHFPVAADLASRLFTLRTTRPYSPNDLEEVAQTIEALPTHG